MEKRGPSGLSIQAIAEKASTPMASVYHFFPTPAAAGIAVAETYLAQLATIIRETAAADRSDAIEGLVAALMRATVVFYNQKPLAGPLIFDSEFSWHIRRADLENNRLMATTIADKLRESFRTDQGAAVDATVEIAISIGDAVWSLSFARHGVVTPEFAAEAERAVIGYMARVALRPPR